MGNRLLQLLKIKTHQISVTNTTYPVIFSSLSLKVIPYFSRFRVGLFPWARHALASTAQTMRCVHASCSVVKKPIPHGTTPVLPCWGRYNKARVTRLRNIVNTTLVSLYINVVRERAFLLGGAGGCALRKKMLVFSSRLIINTAMSAQP